MSFSCTALMGGGGGGCGADEQEDVEEADDEAAVLKGVELLLISFSPAGRHRGKVKMVSAAPLMFLQQPVASGRLAVSHAGHIDLWWVAVYSLVLESSNIFVVFSEHKKKSTFKLVSRFPPNQQRKPQRSPSTVV